jgi:hypothetical protein
MTEMMTNLPGKEVAGVEHNFSCQECCSIPPSYKTTKTNVAAQQTINKKEQYCMAWHVQYLERNYLKGRVHTCHVCHV